MITYPDNQPPPKQDVVCPGCGEPVIDAELVDVGGGVELCGLCAAGAWVRGIVLGAPRGAQEGES